MAGVNFAMQPNHCTVANANVRVPLTEAIYPEDT
jgi:hypothetical protein